MRVITHGSLRRPGGVAGAIGAESATVVVRTRGTERWFEGLRRRAGRPVPAWSHDLAGDGSILWGGHPSWLDVPRAVPLPNRAVALVGGEERLVVGSEDGAVRVRLADRTPPSGPAALLDDLLVVPERTRLVAHAPATLDVVWERDVPRGWYARGTPSDGVVGIGDDADVPAAALWDLRTDAVWDLPFLPHHPAVQLGGILVAASDAGAAAVVAGVDRSSGRVVWERSFPDVQERPRARPPLAAQLLEDGGLLWCAVAAQAVVALDPLTGAERRTLDAGADVTALLVGAAGVVVATAGATLLRWAPDAEQPEAAALPWSGLPAAVLLPDADGAATAIGATGGLARITF